jgi:hypothetical protein
MARGFESKDVEFQQDEAQRRQVKRPPRSPAELNDQLKRREVELSLRRVRRELEAAAHPAHRRMLEEAIAELERRLVSDDDRR